MSRFDSKTLRDRASRMALRVANMARRVTIASSSGGSWGFQGYAIPDLRGGSTITNEGDDYDETELFAGIGIYARPASGDNAEAVILQIGAEADHPTIVAVRNEDARARYESEFGELEAGAVAIFNSAGKARVIVKADGSLELSALSGQAITVTGLVKLGGAAAVDKLLKGTTYRSAEDLMLTALSAAVALIAKIPGLTGPEVALVTAATAAITAFQAAAATYLSTKVDTE